MAEKAGAAQTARILADIDSQAGDAIQAVRDFTAGIYPPLLGAEGLAVALGHQTRRAALPIAVHAQRDRSVSARRGGRRLLHGARGVAEHCQVRRGIEGGRFVE